MTSVIAAAQTVITRPDIEATGLRGISSSSEAPDELGKRAASATSSEMKAAIEIRAVSKIRVAATRGCSQHLAETRCEPRQGRRRAFADEGRHECVMRIWRARPACAKRDRRVIQQS